MLKAPPEIIAMATYDAAVLVAGGNIELAVSSLVSAIVHAALRSSFTAHRARSGRRAPRGGPQDDARGAATRRRFEHVMIARKGTAVAH
jgi:hypothetical protein